jgi:hypothetical protein
VVQELAQGLGPFGTLEGPVNGVRTFGALPKRLRALEGYNRTKEDLERADERTQNALRLLEEDL